MRGAGEELTLADDADGPLLGQPPTELHGAPTALHVEDHRKDQQGHHGHLRELRPRLGAATPGAHGQQAGGHGDHRESRERRRHGPGPDPVHDREAEVDEVERQGLPAVPDFHPREVGDDPRDERDLRPAAPDGRQQVNGVPSVRDRGHPTNR